MSTWTADQRKKMERYADISYFNDKPFISQDLFRFLCGDKISAGLYRTVFDCALLKNAVVKITEDVRSNMTENNIWHSVKNTPLSKWFAPCIDISPCGHFLIQKKVKHLTEDYELPALLPAVFEDTKKTNWGLLSGRLVCHDYQFIERAITCGFSEMVPVEWKE